MVVIGGVGANKKFQTSVAVLDVALWKWSCPLKIQGDAPRPCAYHSATAVKKGPNKEWIVLFGGNNHKTCFNNISVLECNNDNWSWINPVVMGEAPPAPRTGHSATLMEDGSTILIQGGWDPCEAEDDEEFKGLDGCYLLDTKTWEWKALEKKKDSSTTVSRVGHTAVYHDNKVHLFGGRVEGGVFSNELFEYNVPPPS